MNVDAEQQLNNFRSNVNSNFDYINNSPFMMRRINTDPLISEFLRDISGKDTEVVFVENVPYQQETSIGRAMANEEGVRHIKNMLKLIVNSDTVQGNLEKEDYIEFLASTREEITMVIVTNAHDWEVEDRHLNYIIDGMMRTITLFLTRPIDNEERQSYQKEFQSKEVHQIAPQKSGLMSFGSGMKG